MEDLENSNAIITPKLASLTSILLKSTGISLLCGFILWCIVFRESAGDQLVGTVYAWLYENGWVSLKHYYDAFSQVPLLPELLAGGLLVSYIWLLTVLTAMERSGLNARPLYSRMEWVSLRVGVLASVALMLYTPISPSPAMVGTVALLVAIVAFIDWFHNASSSRFRL